MNAPWEEVVRVEVFLNSNNCAISFACGNTHSFFLFYATQVETAQPLSKLGLDFPDLSIGCYRESRYGSLVISFRGKDSAMMPQSGFGASTPHFPSTVRVSVQA
ncbi:hypothetical protein C3L33_02621, partial [Rhododendron williamsianum]